MRNKGFYGIGIEHGKTKYNYWSLFRTAQILDADFLFIIGARFEIHAADTMCSYRHIPVYSYKDFQDFNSHRPFDCKLIGIELTQDAVEISEYNHHKRAIYLLGAEDHGLTKEALRNCQEIIKLYGEKSMNVSIAGSIVIYDRFVKRLVE